MVAIGWDMRFPSVHFCCVYWLVLNVRSPPPVLFFVRHECSDRTTEVPVLPLLASIADQPRRWGSKMASFYFLCFVFVVIFPLASRVPCEYGAVLTRAPLAAAAANQKVTTSVEGMGKTPTRRAAAAVRGCRCFGRWGFHSGCGGS